MRLRDQALQSVGLYPRNSRPHQRVLAARVLLTYCRVLLEPGLLRSEAMEHLETTSQDPDSIFALAGHIDYDVSALVNRGRNIYENLLFLTIPASFAHIGIVPLARRSPCLL